MTLTTVHMLRHGEVYNPEHVMYGRLPGYRLSEAGEGMARTAAAWFADRDVTHLVASPLERAHCMAADVTSAAGDQQMSHTSPFFRCSTLRLDTAPFDTQRSAWPAASDRPNLGVGSRLPPTRAKRKSAAGVE